MKLAIAGQLIDDGYGLRRRDVAAGTVDSVIAALDVAHPGLRSRLLDDDGKIRRFMNVFVNGEDIRFNGGLQTPLADMDEIVILPAIAGGT